MSTCNEYAEFLATLCLETGARPHRVAPLARRLRRLATAHRRRCEVQCNGCPTCKGTGYVTESRYDPVLCEEGAPYARPCPTCSTDALEAAIGATCAELDKVRADEQRTDRMVGWDAARSEHPEQYQARSAAGAAAFVRCIYKGAPNADRPILERLMLAESATFRPLFSGDPRGFTVRLRLPSGTYTTMGGAADGYGIPTSGR